MRHLLSVLVALLALMLIGLPYGAAQRVPPTPTVTLTTTSTRTATSTPYLTPIGGYTHHACLPSVLRLAEPPPPPVHTATPSVAPTASITPMPTATATTVDQDAPTIAQVWESDAPIYREGCPGATTTTVNARIYDAGSGVEWVELHFLAPGDSWAYKIMNLQQADIYVASLGPCSQSGSIRYILGVADHAGNEVQSEEYTVTVSECGTSTPTPTPGWELKFADDFSNPNSGWPEDTGYISRYGYYNGEYRILVYWSGHMQPAYCTSCYISDFVAEVDTRQGSAVQAEYGLAFVTSQDGENFYLFFVNSVQGKYCLLRHECDWGVCNWVPLQDWTSSSYIARYPQTNRLKVIRQESKIEVYVNGYRLGTYFDSTFMGTGWVGLAGAAGYQDNADQRFDNFQLYRWSSTGAEPYDGLSPSLAGSPVPGPPLQSLVPVGTRQPGAP